MTMIIFLYIFMLSAFLGFELIKRIPAILHTPLMSATNFIHGIILIGAIIAINQANSPFTKILASVAVVIATINVVGGFVATHRMLKLFRSEQRDE